MRRKARAFGKGSGVRKPQKIFDYLIEYEVIDNGVVKVGVFWHRGHWRPDDFHRQVKGKIREKEPNKPIKGYFYRDFVRVKHPDQEPPDHE